jgi:hypothetical protein
MTAHRTRPVLNRRGFFALLKLEELSTKKRVPQDDTRFLRVIPYL